KRRTTPDETASTTSLSVPPACLASAFARLSEIDTPAKLRSDEIDLFRIVDGDTMLAMLSRDFGSEIFPTTWETFFSLGACVPEILPGFRSGKGGFGTGSSRSHFFPSAADRCPWRPPRHRTAGSRVADRNRRGWRRCRAAPGRPSPVPSGDRLALEPV